MRAFPPLLSPLYRVPRAATITLLATMAAFAAPGACRSVGGDRILGRDLALADARFAALPATAQFGYAPTPGGRRIFNAAELQLIARINGIKFADGVDICFETPVHTPDDVEFMEAMRLSLPQRATLRVVDRERTAVPAGRMVFPLSGLEPAAAGNDNTQLWRGFVQYSDTRRLSLWARVSIAVSYPTVVAARDLSEDTPIGSDVLRVEERTGPLSHVPAAARIEDVAGHVVRHPLKAGSEIPLALLDDPPAVRRGDSIRVEVRSGLAVLHFDAVAESRAREGEMAELRNPITGKTFHARIVPDPKLGSKAVVVVGQGPAL
jgi:flagella basal body P-ring formation protein FlgA